MNRRSFLKLLVAVIAAPFVVKAKGKPDVQEQPEALCFGHPSADDKWTTIIYDIDYEYDIDEHPCGYPNWYLYENYFKHDVYFESSNAKAEIIKIGRIYDGALGPIITNWAFRLPRDMDAIYNVTRDGQYLLCGYNIGELREITDGSNRG
jgi:hypothetical protein